MALIPPVLAELMGSYAGLMMRAVQQLCTGKLQHKIQQTGCPITKLA
jgi:hypothetical protein